jgi:predicted O-methyltransferase YrrM
MISYVLLMQISKFIFFTAVSLTVMTASLSGVPTPYQEVSEVMPFNDFGWYANGAVLESLIKKHRINTVIEVGSFLGRSTMHIAKCLPKKGKVYAVDHWEGSIEHQTGGFASDLPIPLNQLYQQFLSNVIHAGLTDKIIPIRQPSLVAAQDASLKGDLIYIDAAHDTESVYQDLSDWYPHLNKRGIIAGDDWSWPSVREGVRLFMEDHPDLTLRAEGNCYWLK